jgi:alanine racemase
MQKQYSDSNNLQEYSDRIVKIDCSALTQNFNNIKKIAANSEVIAYVKGDAYGHGIVGIVRHLRSIGMTMFAVASVNELLAIREYFLDVRVLVSSTYCTPQILDIVSRNNGDIVVFHDKHVDVLQEVSLPNKVNVWLKVNTGMNRMGITQSKLKDSLSKLKKCQNVFSDDIILMSHFACADDKNAAMNLQQIEKFIAATENISLRRSMANSAGILNFPASHFDIVRPGLLLYGVSPLNHSDSRLQSFKPVMTVEARVIALNDIPEGESLGYRSSYKAPSDKKIAVVAFGYADGYPVSLKSDAYALINDIKCPVVARVSMDTMMLDVSHLEEVAIGDKVTIWGNGLDVSYIAKAANMISYELLCHVSKRRTCYIYSD